MNKKTIESENWHLKHRQYKQPWDDGFGVWLGRSWIGSCQLIEGKLHLVLNLYLESRRERQGPRLLDRAEYEQELSFRNTT